MDAHRTLTTELISAVCEDPSMLVQTPAYPGAFAMTAAAVVEDLLGGVGAEQNWRDLVTILGRCAAGKMDQLTHLRAAALLASLAKQHADFHADDLRDRLAEDEE